MKFGVGVIALAGYLLSASCSTTPVDPLMAQYEEQERIIAYKIWEKACRDAGGVMCITNPIRSCVRHSDCIPHKMDWSHKRRVNRLVCARECLQR